MRVQPSSWSCDRTLSSPKMQRGGGRERPGGRPAPLFQGRRAGPAALSSCVPYRCLSSVFHFSSDCGCLPPGPPRPLPRPLRSPRAPALPLPPPFQSPPGVCSPHTHLRPTFILHGQVCIMLSNTGVQAMVGGCYMGAPVVKRAKRLFFNRFFSAVLFIFIEIKNRNSRNPDSRTAAP